MADDQTNPTPQQLEIARKIGRMAAEPVEGLQRRFRILGWPAEYQAIVLEELTRKAAIAAAAAREAARDG